MRYHHLCADDAGESHWRNVEVVLEERTFAPPAHGILVSEPEAVTRMMFLKLPAGWNEPVHPTPKKQALICLAAARQSKGDVLDYVDRFYNSSAGIRQSDIGSSGRPALIKLLWSARHRGVPDIFDISLAKHGVGENG